MAANTSNAQAPIAPRGIDLKGLRRDRLPRGPRNPIRAHINDKGIGQRRGARIARPRELIDRYKRGIGEICEEKGRGIAVQDDGWGEGPDQSRKHRNRERRAGIQRRFRENHEISPDETGRENVRGTASVARWALVG
jgi:hypothetical protein